MTGPTPPEQRRLAWQASSDGVDWHLELDRAILIPGQLVTGRVRLLSRDGVAARGLVVALTATEHWRHRETQSNAQGGMTTRVVTTKADVTHEPVQVRDAVTLGAGETLTAEFELPVPPDGPASLEADDAGLDWTVEAKLDIASGFDSGLQHAVVVAQPTALLRAGAVPLGEFALYESTDVTGDGISGSIELKPMPLVCGAPFSGRVTLRVPSQTQVRGVRAELRVHVEATVSQGESQTITLWTGQLATAGPSGAEELAGERTFEINATLPATALPSIELPHGRTSATFHVILDRPMAIDTHLSRDVGIATTSEV